MFNAFAVARLKRLWCCRQAQQRPSHVNFHLTSRRCLGFFVRISANQNTTPHMKKLSVLSMLIPLAMVCSCQKQNAATEEQLAQRKTELDTREKALDEREKALAGREKAVARAAMLPADHQLRALRKDANSNVPPSATIPPGLAPPDNSQLKASRAQ